MKHYSYYQLILADREYPDILGLDVIDMGGRTVGEIYEDVKKVLKRGDLTLEPTYDYDNKIISFDYV